MIQRDILTVLKLMILSFTFYQIEDKNHYNHEEPGSSEKDFLQRVIKQHPLWSMTDFWEAAILTSIKEELKSQKTYLLNHEESNSDTLFRERNIVFGQLASYCNNMLMFHIEKSVVKEIIGNFCKWFNLTEAQIKELNVFFLSKFFIKIFLIEHHRNFGKVFEFPVSEKI